MIEWIQANYVAMFAIIGVIYTAARMIVVLTPTPKDDAALDKIWVILKMLGKAVGLDLKQGREAKPTNKVLSAILLLCLTLGCQPGIKGNDRAEILIAQKTFTVTVEILTEMQKLGKFESETTQRLTILIHEGQEYLARWVLAIEAGECKPYLGDSISDIIRQLIYIQLTEGGDIDGPSNP